MRHIHTVTHTHRPGSCPVWPQSSTVGQWDSAPDHMGADWLHAAHFNGGYRRKAEPFSLSLPRFSTIERGIWTHGLPITAQCLSAVGNCSTTHKWWHCECLIQDSGVSDSLRTISAPGEWELTCFLYRSISTHTKADYFYIVLPAEILHLSAWLYFSLNQLRFGSCGDKHWAGWHWAPLSPHLKKLLMEAIPRAAPAVLRGFSGNHESLAGFTRWGEAEKSQ